MQAPLISFIIPIYNRENFLPKCIESVINQTFKKIEIILIDDGSTDSSLKICKNYAHEDKRITVISQKNGGVSKARNTGIKKASGTYIIFIDSDDYIDIKLAETLVNKTKEIKNPDLIIYGFVNETPDGKICFYEKASKEIKTRDEFLNSFSDLLDKNLLRSPVNKLYKTKILKDNKLSFNESAKIAEDAIFNIKYYQYVKNVSVLTFPLYHIINHNTEGRLTLNYYKNNMELQNIFFTSVIDFLTSNNTLIKSNTEILNKQYNSIVSHIIKQMASTLKSNLHAELQRNYTYLLTDLVNKPGSFILDGTICNYYQNKHFFISCLIALNIFKQRAICAKKNRKIFKCIIWNCIAYATMPYYALILLRKWY